MATSISRVSRLLSALAAGLSIRLVGASPTLLGCGVFASLLAVGCSEAEEAPRHTLAYVLADGRVIGRHAEDIDAIAEVMEFELTPTPATLGGYPLMIVEGVVNETVSPSQSRVAYWYGPVEMLDDDTLTSAQFRFVQAATLEVPWSTDGEDISVDGHPAQLQSSRGSPFVAVAWEACGHSFQLTAWDSSRSVAIAAAGRLITECEQ